MKTKQTWEERFREFWYPLITTNGKLDLEKIKDELNDWDFVMKQVPLVYEHVAGLSKVMYSAQVIIDQHDSRCHEFCVDKDDHEQELTKAREEEKIELKERLGNIKNYRSASYDDWQDRTIHFDELLELLTFPKKK